jgi:toxin ParE1/3/4
VSKKNPVEKAVHLTDRALQDLISVEEYSIETWGKRVSNRYIGDIEAALQRLSDNPEILREEPHLHEFLYFYRVNKHLLVCDVQPGAIFVLTVMHASMDIPEVLTELEPTLKLEVEMLHQQLQKAKKRSR